MRPMRLARLIALAALSLGLAAACATVEPTPTPEPVTLRYACTDADNPRYAQLIAAFQERHPQITVEMVGESYETADAVMLPTLFMQQGPLSEQQGPLSEMVIALDPYIEGDASFSPEQFMPGTLEMLRDEGRLWGLPAGVDPLVLFYNKDLFDAAGVPYPEMDWTWEDFLSKAELLTDARSGVYGYAPMDATLDAVGFIYQHGGGFLDSLTDPTRPTFDDPRNVEALEWWLGLSIQYMVAPTLEELQRAGSPQATVYANKVAMWMGWFSERGGSLTPASSSTWPAPWTMRWGVAPVPREAASTTVAMVGAYFISRQSQHPDAAWEWIAFLSGQAAHVAAPARLSTLSSEDYEQLVGADVAELARAVLADAQLLSPRLARYGAAFEMLGGQLQNVARGVTTAQDALEAVQKVAERARP
jgi:multiple sugar transport system substrate-binding protein